MSECCPGCAALEMRLAVIEARLRALGQGLGGDGHAAPATTPPAAPVPLQALRPKAWAEGQRAAREGIAAMACPYKSTRGGFRNAWLGGHGTVTGVVAVPGIRPRPAPALLKPRRPADPPRLSPERRRGIEAGQAGESITACPFGLNEQRQRDEWQAGWRMGREKRQTG